jgi:hypothetical protein
MSFSIGGLVITDLEYTRSWGLSPASAKITGVGSHVAILNSEVVISLGGASFHGVLSRVLDETQDGARTTMEFVDNRIKLMADDVYALFNRVEVRPDNPLTPGIDRQKRYVHILPGDWDTQRKTYTNDPMSAQEIIEACFGAPTVDHAWSGSYHGAQSGPVHEIDALTGKKLGNVIQEITDAQGLVFTLDGENTLRWARKGEDIAPGFSAVNTSERSSGAAVSAVDTQISVVGDRNRYQDMGITLVPDWNGAYEAFWNEPDWLAEVANVFGLGGDDFATRAQIAAKARKVTVRDYVTARGGGGLADYGMWGEVSRMEIPVWTYLHDILYKAYTVPRGYSFRGIPLDSLELVEGLLCSVDYTLNGVMSYNRDSNSGGGYYPDAKAFLLVKGQQLSLVDPTKQRVITAQELQRAGTEYAPENKFNMDTRNKTIIFESAVFIPNNLFVFPNAGTDAPASMQAIAVPNAAAAIAHADVKASLVWDAERYRQVFGSGDRKGPHYVNGLAIHKLFVGGSDQGEITYADGESADAKASAIAASLIGQQSTYASGGFKSNGSYGAALNGSTDRVTTRLTFEGGISETVEFSKERAQSNFENERDLERKQRAKDLFPGQRNLRDDVKSLELIAKVSKELKRSPLEPVYGSLAAVMEKPVGATDCSVSKIYDSAGGAWAAGEPLFLDEHDAPSDIGQRFGGIVIPQNASRLVPCATQGIVPVRVQGPFQTGDTVGVDDGVNAATVGGSKFIGQIQSPDYAGSGVVLAMVDLGKGAAAQEIETPFQVVRLPHAPDQDELIGVISNSHLLNSEDKDTHEEDNGNWGLLSDDRTAGGVSIETLNIGDKIWLEIQLAEDQSIVGINVQYGPVGPDNLWDEYPDPIAINVDDPQNPFQEFYNQIIAEITDPEEDPRPGFVVVKGDGDSAVRMQVTQVLFTNLMMTPAHTAADADEPNLPLLVAVPWNSPGTATNGSADEINSENDLMTPWVFGELAEEGEYSFKLVDQSTSDQAKVRIVDGEVNGVLPDGMGNDDFALDLFNNDNLDPASGGENDVWLEIDYEPDGSINSVTCHAGSADELPESEFGFRVIKLGYALVEWDTDLGQIKQVTVHNTQAGDMSVDLAPLNKYAFQMFDATDNEGPKVLIMDGKVNGIDGSDHIPDGMGNDDYVLPVDEDWDVWLDISYDPITFEIIDPITIAAGPEMPNDTREGEVAHSFVQIGYVDVETGDGDEVPQIIPHNSLTDDYEFRKPEESAVNHYAFEMVDASDDEGAKVLIFDGKVNGINGTDHLPQGMGNDDYVLPVEDGWDVWLIIPFDIQTFEVLEPVTIDAGPEMPSDQEVNGVGYSYVQIGFVSIDTEADGSPHVMPVNTLAGDYNFQREPIDNRYSFELIDASDEFGAKVLILDGQVFGPNDDGNLPAGMGGDDYIIGVFDGAEVYLVITVDDDSQNVTSVTIGVGDSTPDDTNAAGESVHYVTIGYIAIDSSGAIPIVNPTNALCGDYTLPYELAITGTDDQGVDVEIDGANQMNLLGAVSVHHDPADDNPNSVDVVVGPDLADDAGGEVDNPTRIIFTTEPSLTDNTIVEAGDPGEAIVHIGLPIDAADEDGNEVNGIERITFTRAKPIDEDPDHIVEDNGNGEVIVHVPLGVDVAGDTGLLDNAELIHFDGATVEDGGNGEAIVHILPSTVDVSGDTGLLDNAQLIHFVGATVTDGGGGEAIVDITPTGAVDVSGDTGLLDNVELIHFVGATVTDGGGGEAIVHITPIGTVDVSGDTGLLDNAELIHFVGATISDGGGGEAIVTILPTGAVDVSGDTGLLDNVELIHFVGATVSDGGGGEAIVNISPTGSVDVSGDTGLVDNVQLIHFVGAPVTDGGGGEVLVHIPIGVDLLGDTGSMDNVELIHFEGADVQSFGGGEAIVKIPKPTVDLQGDTGSVNGVDLLHFQGANVVDHGGGEALIDIIGRVDVAGDSGSLDNAELLFFDGADISDGGGGEAVIHIPKVIDVSDDGGRFVGKASQLHFTGARVSAGGPGIADVDISAGSALTVEAYGSNSIGGPVANVSTIGVTNAAILAVSPGVVEIDIFGYGKPQSGTWVLGVINGAWTWLQTNLC